MTTKRITGRATPDQRREAARRLNVVAAMPDVAESGPVIAAVFREMAKILEQSDLDGVGDIALALLGYVGSDKS